MPRGSHRAALAALALVALACRGGRRGPPPERFVPADATAAIVVPEVGRAARELAALHASIARFPGAGEIAGARGALAAQLGFDPLDPEALEGAGVDARRGLAIASLDRRLGPKGEPVPRVLVVLPVEDAAKLEALFVRLARDRLGATERAAEAHGPASVVTLRAPGAAAPALAYAIVQRTALLCAGAGGAEAVGEAGTVAAEASLAESAAWKVARRALGEQVAAVQWVPPGSRWLSGMWAVKDGLAAAVSAAPGRLVARAAILLGAREPSFRALAADGAGAKALARLDPEAHLAARWDGDPAALGKKLAPMLPAGERARLAAHGVDLERDVAGVLAPGAAVTVSLAPGLDLEGLTAEAARTDPLRAIEFEAVLPVRDAAAAEATSTRIAAAGGAPGAHGKRPARAASASAAADGVHRLRTASGEIAWRVDAEASRIVAAGGRPGRLEALEARIAGGAGYEAPTPAAQAALAGGLGGAVLDPARLVAAIRAMPEEAFGSGPSGFVMRSLVDRVIEPASRLAAVSLRADLAEGALVLALDVEARPEGAP